MVLSDLIDPQWMTYGWTRTDVIQQVVHLLQALIDLLYLSQE